MTSVPIMNRTTSFVFGFAAGWLARSTVDSSRDALVNLTALALDMAGRVRRAATLERERLEDLLAEVRARADERATERARSRAAAHADGRDDLRRAGEAVGSAE